MGSVKAMIEQSRDEVNRDHSLEDDLPPKPLTEQEKKEEFIEQMFSGNETAGKAQDPFREEGEETKSPPSAPSSNRKLLIERDPDSRDEPQTRPSVRKELEQIRKEMDKEKTGQDKEIQKSPQHKAPKKKRKKVKTR